MLVVVFIILWCMQVLCLFNLFHVAPTNRTPCVGNNWQRIILKRGCDFSVMWSEWWPVKTETPPTCQLTFLHNQPTDLYNQWLKPLRNAVYIQEKSTLSLFVSKSLYDDNKVLFFGSTQKITEPPPQVQVVDNMNAGHILEIRNNQNLLNSRFPVFLLLSSWSLQQAMTVMKTHAA